MPTRSQTAGNKSLMDDSNTSQPTISSMLSSSTAKKNKNPPTTSTIKKGNASSSSKQSATTTTANDDDNELEKMSDHDLLLTLVQDLRHLSAKFDNMNKIMASFDERIKKQEVNCDKNTEEIEKYKNQLEKLEEEVESIRIRSKSNNIIRGITPKQNDHPHKTATEFINHKLKADHQKVCINSVKYLWGKDGRVSLLVGLGADEDKQYLYSHVRNLQRPYVIMDDLTLRQQKQKNLLLQKRRQLIDEGTDPRTIKVKINSMKIGAEWFILKVDGSLERKQRLLPHHHHQNQNLLSTHHHNASTSGAQF
jgi:hypothetical protein